MPLDQNDLALIDAIVLSRLQALSPPDRGGGIALRQTKRLQKELDKIEVIIDLNKIRFSAQTVQGLEALTTSSGVQVGSLGVVLATGNIYRAITATAGGSTWAPASGTRTWRDYGADSSGTNDAAAAINAALASGGDVLGETGSYRISSQVRCSVAGTVFRGEGQSTRIFSVTDLPMVFVQEDDVEIGHMTIEGSGDPLHTTQALLRVSGNRARAYLHDLWLNAAGAEAFRCLGAANSLTDSDLERIRHEGCQRGIEFVDSPSVDIRCRAIVSRKAGVALISGIAFSHTAIQVLIEACDLEANGFGVSIAGIRKVTIRDTECYGATDATRGEGIHLETSNAGVGDPLRDVLVEGCRAHDNLRGIVFGGNDDTGPFRSCERIQIRNSESFDNALTGIYGFDFIGAQIVGNFVWGNGRQGIYCANEEVTNSATDLVVENNLVYDNNESAGGFSGIEIGAGVTRYRVANNVSQSGMGFGTGTQDYGLVVGSVDRDGVVWDNVLEGNANRGIDGVIQGRQTFRFESTDASAVEVASVCQMPANGDMAQVRMIAIGTETNGAATGRVRTIIERVFERTAGVLNTLGTTTNNTSRSGGFATAAFDLPSNGAKKMARATGEGVGVTISWNVVVESTFTR